MAATSTAAMKTRRFFSSFCGSFQLYTGQRMILDLPLFTSGKRCITTIIGHSSPSQLPKNHAGLQSSASRVQTKYSHQQLLVQQHCPNVFSTPFSIERFPTTTLLAQVPCRKFGSTSTRDGGEDVYQEALNAMKKVHEMQLERERAKSTEMYNAWQKATEKQQQFLEQKEQEQKKGAQKKKKTTQEQKQQSINRSGGVAVVKTIVKQARNEKDRGENNVVDTEEEETYWKQQARKLLEEAALVHNHPEALVRLGNVILEEGGGNIQRAMDLYQKGGEQGCAEGWFNFGQLLWTGYPVVVDNDDLQNKEQKVECDPEAAMEAFWKAIDGGDVDAMYFVGVQILATADDDGDGSNNTSVGGVTMEKGLELIQGAAKENHGGALYYLALLHLNGNESLALSSCEETFVRYLDNAVDAGGDSDAMFLRGHCYFDGNHGYAKDYPKALQDFVASAELGNADAAVSAGAMMHSGQYPGVPKNQSKAFEMYQLAGELGSVEGWRNVVACYAHGEGVPQSKETAKYIANIMLKEEDNP